MLTYEINSGDRVTTSTALDASEWAMSSDGFTVSFVVPEGAGVLDGDLITVESESLREKRTCEATARTVTRQGYVLVDNIYEAHEDEEGAYGITFSDGIFRQITDGKVTILGEHVDVVDGKATVTEKAWIEDGKVEIHGDVIEVDTDLVPNGDGTHTAPEIEHMGKTYEWLCHEPETWENVTHVSLSSEGEERVEIDGASCGKFIPYILFGGAVTRISVETEKDAAGQDVKVCYAGDERMRCELERSTEFGNERVVINGEKYAIEKELVSSKRGSFILLYANGFNNVRVGDILSVEAGGNGRYEAEVVGDGASEHIVWYGRRYEKGDGTWDFVKIGETEHEVTYEDDDRSTFTAELDGSVCRFRISDDGKTAVRMTVSATDFMDEVHYGKNEYDMNRYEYFEIGGERIRVEESTRPLDDGSSYHTVRTVYVPEGGSYRMPVAAIYEPNIIRCEVPNYGLSDGEYEDECEIAASRIDSGDVYVTRHDRMFSGRGNEESGDEAVMETPFEGVNARKVNNYINIPVPLSVDFSENLFSEDLTANAYADRVVSEMMNAPVDLEKDIYYPVSADGSRIGKITVLTHFRERNKEWEVIEGKSWNMYPESKDRSDLLTFLGFKNTDVYYQKSKIAKSFLRISVFDGSDPATQNLLYMGTVFMDENRLYKRMMDSGSSGLEFHPYYDTSVSYSSSTVFSECSDGNVERYRLDSTFEIGDRDATDTSSEGFYWYIFRELGTLTEERTLYARFDFCHAGKGVSLPMVPYPTGEDEIKVFEDGYPMEEVSGKLYVPVRARYDFAKKRYVYSFPKHMEKDGGFELNLFELKIKDES